MLRTMHDYCRHSWLVGMEAFDTIDSYSADAARALQGAASNAGRQLYGGRCALPYEVFFNLVPDEHIRFFESLRTHYVTPNCICTHAGLDPGIARLEDQSHDALVWGTRGFPDEYDGADLVVYGHWGNAVLDSDGWPSPQTRARSIGIDTIEHGVLTAIRLPDRRVFQSGRY